MSARRCPACTRCWCVRPLRSPFALAVQGPKNEVGYVLAFQPKSFDWRARNARPHPWGAGHDKVLAAALKKLDAICGVREH